MILESSGWMQVLLVDVWLSVKRFLRVVGGYKCY